MAERRAKDSTLPQPIVLNAWEGDICGDPLLAIVSALIDAVGKNGGSSHEEATKLRDAAKDVAWFAAGIANSFVANATGIDAIAAGAVAEGKKAAREKKLPDYVAIYEHRLTALQSLKAALRQAFGPKDQHALVMVDELDRCRPDYAISYLETIKHVFDVPGLIFVLAVDYAHLGNSARALFGEDLVFEEYFRKFVQRAVALPNPDGPAVQRLAEKYTRAFLANEGKRSSLLDLSGGHRVENIVELTRALGLGPRQVQEVFRIVGHTLTRSPEQKGEIYWCIGVGVILLAALKVGSATLYASVVRADESGARVLYEFLTSKLDSKEKVSWWLAVYLAGLSGRPGKTEINIEAKLAEFGFRERAHGEIGQFVRGWGHSTSDRILQIHQNIETVGKF